MRKGSRSLVAVAAIVIASSSSVMAVAQTPTPSARLADVMAALQGRHSKLWTAGEQRNWALAGYELELVKAALGDAIGLYIDIPVSNVTMVDGPLKSLDRAIAARNSAEFGKAFGELTRGCNSCHRSTGRGFLVMTIPKASPFGNQSFAPGSGNDTEGTRR
jgi:hypothetical protein